MTPIDIIAIEQRARQLRAEEIRRLQGVFAQRARLYFLLLGASLLHLLETLSEALRPLFSWNPQVLGGDAERSDEPTWLTRTLRAWHAHTLRF